MRYKINSTGNVIIADQAFVDAHYPNDYTLIPDPVPDPKIAQRAAIEDQLDKIDRQTNKPRTLREIQLGNPDTLAWLAGKDAEAVVLRAQLAALG